MKIVLRPIIVVIIILSMFVRARVLRYIAGYFHLCLAGGRLVRDSTISAKRLRMLRESLDLDDLLMRNANAVRRCVRYFPKELQLHRQSASNCIPVQSTAHHITR